MVLRMAVSLQYPIYLPLIYNIERYPIGDTGVWGNPKDRARVGMASHIGRRYSFRVHPDPTCLIFPTASSFLQGGGISTINLPTLSILFCHRPTGGESYGLSNRLAA